MNDVLTKHSSDRLKCERSLMDWATRTHKRMMKDGLDRNAATQVLLAAFTSAGILIAENYAATILAMAPPGGVEPPSSLSKSAGLPLTEGGVNGE